MSSKNSIFQTTIWTAVVQASNDSEGSAGALDDLCRRYWKPLYVYALGVGLAHEDAEDATQAFFAKLLVNRAMLGKADRNKGRFRTYLLASFKYFLADLYEKEQSQRRGGKVAHVDLVALEFEQTHSSVPPVESPEAAYDQQWAIVLVNRAMAATRQECEEMGKADWFDRLGGERSDATPYEKVAAELGTTLDGVKSFVLRLKRRFRAALEREVAATVSEAGEVAAEMAYLATLLRNR